MALYYPVYSDILWQTPLTLLAAGSLSAFLPLVALSAAHWLAVDAQFGPAGLLRERIEAGAPCAVFASANAAHRRRCCRRVWRRNAGICQQPADADRPAVAGQRWLDWLALLSTPRLRLATSTPGCDPSGDYTAAVRPN
ncbi:substrate-binding domain-containing protein [Klebsiella pneumoniae]|uniref:Substrate-binding domain-containing protein n=1 Tax=Klebsiella pneumoniae TaxID=573 RepID=A0A939SST0_KLEPN|nr:substrate-binding domain-containing protein [Klebsiella pneumoniae]